MRAALGVLLLLAAAPAGAQLPPQPEPVEDVRAQSTSREPEASTPGFALLLAGGVAALLALAPRRA